LIEAFDEFQQTTMDEFETDNCPADYALRDEGRE